jgi:Tfp pilus assembly protein PilF
MTRNITLICTLALAMLTAYACNSPTSATNLQQARSYLAQKNYPAAREQIQQFEARSEHTAESLWLGIQAEYPLGNQRAVSGYVEILRNRYPKSAQYQSYLDLLRSTGGH